MYFKIEHIFLKNHLYYLMRLHTLKGRKMSLIYFEIYYKFSKFVSNI